MNTASEAMVALALVGALAATAAGQPIARYDGTGQPADVGLLVLGHSTSAVGDWPDKLADALNQDQEDGRNYVVFRAITGGDGGFLWTRAAFLPGDLDYERVRSSSSAATPPQWCEDGATRVRYSCRRAKLEWTLTGRDPVPAASACRGAVTGCAPPASIPCVWHDEAGRFERPLPPHECWAKMDVRLALVQDTSNRSWPLDDYTRDGRLDDGDRFQASAIPAAAWRCPAAAPNPSGVVTSGGTQWIDWDCNGSLTAADAARRLYAAWLRRLAVDLLTRFGSAGVDQVFVTQKPVEMTPQCARFFPGEVCGPHLPRSPSPSRPFFRYYLPTVFWEYRALETLFSDPGLDPRIHLVSPGDARALWNRSALCYEDGILADWTIPAGSGRPDGIKSDDAETDAGPGADAASVGCMAADHVHHNDAGGWMMADVWYGALLPYLR